MSRKKFDEFVEIKNEDDFNNFVSRIKKLKYNGTSSVRTTKTGWFMCGIHVDSNKLLAPLCKTWEMAERLYIEIEKNCGMLK